MRRILVLLLLALPLLAQRQTVRTLNQTAYASQFNWVRHPSSPSSISAGATTITRTPCPFGIATGSPYTVAVGGTGTPETVSVTGGTCTRGAASGTIVFTAANSHSAGYSISSASNGLQEAINDSVTVGGSAVIIDSAWGGSTVSASIYGTTAVGIQDIRGGFTLYQWNGSNYTATLPPPYIVTNGSPGTTLFKTVQIDTSGHATIGAASSTKVIGVTVGGAGTSGSATVAYAGLVPIIATGTTTIGHFALVSATPGEVDDSATETPGVETLGTFTTVNSGAGTTAIVAFSPHLAQGAVSPCGTAHTFAIYSAIGQIVVCDTNTADDGAGNASFVSVTTTDASHAGALNLNQGPAPASIPANGAQIAAGTSVTGYRFELPSTAGAVNDFLCVTSLTAVNWEVIGSCPILTSNNVFSGTAEFSNASFKLSGLTASRPLYLDASKLVQAGTFVGNTTAFQMETGTATSGNLPNWDASGNLTDSGIAATTIPPVYVSAGTLQTSPHIVQDTCTLGTSCSVTLSGSAVYTSSSSYTCTCSDNTSAAACKVAQSSGSAFAITGTGTDVIRYICVGK